MGDTIHEDPQQESFRLRMELRELRLAIRQIHDRALIADAPKFLAQRDRLLEAAKAARTSLAFSTHTWDPVLHLLDAAIAACEEDS